MRDTAGNARGGTKVGQQGCNNMSGAETVAGAEGVVSQACLNNRNGYPHNKPMGGVGVARWLYMPVVGVGVAAVVTGMLGNQRDVQNRRMHTRRHIGCAASAGGPNGGGVGVLRGVLGMVLNLPSRGVPPRGQSLSPPMGHTLHPGIEITG